jgi:hypothetical protein
MNVEAAVDIALPYSKCTRIRLMAMAKALVKLDKHGIEGDVVECGVWRGGGVVLSRLLSDRVVWLYDTFQGMTNQSEYDVVRSGRRRVSVGKHAVTRLEVVASLENTNTMNLDALRFVAGPVEETLLQKDHVPDKIALLHLDTDWYHSTKIELETLWPRVQSRGIMIVDDYGHWQGARKAVDEYFSSAERRTKIVIDYTAIMMVKA